MRAREFTEGLMADFVNSILDKKLKRNDKPPVKIDNLPDRPSASNQPAAPQVVPPSDVRSRPGDKPNPWRQARFSRSDPSTWPAKGRLASGVGYRKDPITGEASQHNGIDIAAAIGTPVRSPVTGKVVATDDVGTFVDSRGKTAKTANGKFVIIANAEDAKEIHYFLHLNSVAVSKGHKVEAYMTQIGEVGNTGRSTGSHLHWEVQVNGRPIDPFKL